ncbi:MAG TPA: Hsp70 family protein [Candidatus Angelobacter sp.]|jgi:hypothetical protein
MVNSKKRNFDYLPLSIRLETLGGIATPLVLRGTPLPATRSESFSTASDQQTSVEIKILMGESSLSRNNLVLGTFRLKEIPKAKRGEAQITVEFSLDKTCALTARATLKGTQLAAEEGFSAPDLSDDFVKKVLAEAEASRESDEWELARREVKGRAQMLLGEAEERLRAGPNAKLSEAVAALGLAMSSDKDQEIKERTEGLTSILHPPDFSNFSGIFSSMFDTRKPRPTHKTQPVVSRARTSPPKPQEDLAPSAPQHPLGKIFGGGSFTLEPQLCFVLMPFDAKFQAVYEDHIRPTIERAGLRCERADEIRGVKQITADIWERINRCRFLVAELTDQNANVFYELGLAHALGKDVILITQSMSFVPFDIKTLRCIVYDTTARGAKKLENDLAATIGSVIKSS